MTHTESATVVSIDLQQANMFSVGGVPPPQFAVVTLQLATSGARFQLSSVPLEQMTLFVLGATVELQISAAPASSSATPTPPGS